MAKPASFKRPALMKVTKFVDISSDLRRITFSSPELAYYPVDCAAAHIKIFLPHPHQEKPVLPTITENGPIWPTGEQRPIARSYTVRYIRPEQHEIDIEFVLHDAHGPAGLFAQNVQPGQYIAISYPRPLTTSFAQHNYLVGDNTAFPAIAAMLETMPKTSQGHVFLLAQQESAQIALIKPEKVTIHWFTGDRKQQTAELISAFKQLTRPEEQVYFWLAGENDLVVALRNYLRRERQYDKTMISAVPYWRQGVKEEDYHDTRHQVMDE